MNRGGTTKEWNTFADDWGPKHRILHIWWQRDIFGGSNEMQERVKMVGNTADCKDLQELRATRS